MNPAVLKRKRQDYFESMDTESYPLPEGKPETYMVFGELKGWNTETGKYDLPVNSLDTQDDDI